MLPAKNGPIYFERREPPKCSGVLFSQEKTLQAVTEIYGGRQRAAAVKQRDTFHWKPGFLSAAGWMKRRYSP